jgi:anti-sigma B factor antagonist
MATTAVPRAAHFSVALGDEGTTLTLTAVGEIDIASSPVLRHAAADALERPCDVLVIDLDQVTFIDSTGIHALIDIQGRCRREGVVLRVLPAADGVHAVFELCGLADRLPFMPRSHGAEA